MQPFHWTEVFHDKYVGYWKKSEISRLQNEVTKVDENNKKESA